jgi:hypothetical protein
MPKTPDENRDNPAADALNRRAKKLSPPIQRCGALFRRVPKLPGGVENPAANCLTRLRNALQGI